MSDWYRCILCEVYCGDYEEHLTSDGHINKILADHARVPRYIFPCEPPMFCNLQLTPREGVPSNEALWNAYFKHNSYVMTVITPTNRRVQPTYSVEENESSTDSSEEEKPIYNSLASSDESSSDSTDSLESTDESSFSEERPEYRNGWKVSYDWV